MIKPKVLVTGANGFVGEALVFHLLLGKKFTPIAAVRGETRLQGLCPVVRFDLVESRTLPSLADVEVIVHAAARVHVMHETVTDALAEFRKVNVEGTLRLARLAAEAGVKRFIYLSSIKVNGESTARGGRFMPDDMPAPADPYGVSKLEAEIALQQLGMRLGMEIVIIRPPLVYGPGVKANFHSMMRWVAKGVPLPLGGLCNNRSLVSIGNLVDLIERCIAHPAAAGNTFLVSDGEDLSTTQLLRRVAAAMGVKSRLVAVPPALLQLGASLVCRPAIAQRLCGSLQVDIQKTCRILEWSPPEKIDQALCRTANEFLQHGVH
ncbi:SDR family oxidoreductase [Pseudomonas sp. B21-051]|uniref:UDP-glucose 4-epimerase family protein n=1 Tax=Pseudomonas sp. B21-051 TaxID=2895491 RepID=UPI00215FE3A4|nr:SDR family oxidoreductase [Pseudomonas sp. B21-051]UVK86910.1 SDR family oxidoreductase [Pseudomonas sp. B21-051]